MAGPSRRTGFKGRPFRKASFGYTLESPNVRLDDAHVLTPKMLNRLKRQAGRRGF